MAGQQLTTLYVLPPREIARRTGAPVETVRTRLARGLERLRARLDREHGGDRKAWALALLPVARPAADLSPALIGPLLMNAKILLPAGAVLLLGTLSYLALGRDDDAAPAPATVSAAPPAGSASPGAAAVDGLASELTGPGAATERSAAAPVEGTDPAPAPANANPHAVLRGRVLDDLGRAAAGVRVALAPSGSAVPGGVARATSGADGHFEMAGVPGGGRILADDERYATVLAGLAGERPGVMLPVVVVAPRVRLAGRVFAEEGMPIAGARIDVEMPGDEFRARFREVLDRSMDRHWATRTGEDGRFAIDDAPRVEGAMLRAASDGYESFRAPLAEAAGGGLTITLLRPRSADGLLSGIVIDEAGAPVEGARVAFGLATTSTDGDGGFRFRLEDPDSVNVRFGVEPETLVAARKGHLPARYEPPRVEGRPSWPARVTLRLGAAALSIAGRVLDHRYRPFPGAQVWIADATLLGGTRRGPVVLESLLAGHEDVGWRRVDADAQGRFEIDGLVARDYRLRAMDPATLLIAEEGPFAAGSAGIELRLPTDRLFPRVAGRVVSRSGRGIAGASVYPMCDAFRITYRGAGVSTSHEALDGTRTGPDGAFELENVPRSLVYLRVEGEAILPVEYGRHVEGDERFADTQVRELPGDRIEELTIVVPLRCHFQVELVDPALGDEIAVLDESGREMIINLIAGNSRRETERAPITDGRSSPLAVTDAGTTLVLYKGRVEVARRSLALEPGELVAIRW